ncbi:uncharacterized protein LOC135154109 [Lytechinus pictus]|uniref:uncharacterized protein LOC135154109 n=1 Tax=Lytechinus pictus TaxID=7653 RepID=UPI0030B9F054
MIRSTNMSLAITIFLMLFAHVTGNDGTPDPTKYCLPHEYRSTQVGVEDIMMGGKPVGGKHRIFSAVDFVHDKFYTNKTLTTLDASGQPRVDERQDIIDRANNAHYVVTNGECKKYPVTTVPERCLNDKMKYTGTWDITAYGQLPDDGLQAVTFTVDLELPDMGMTGQRVVTFVQEPNPEFKPDSYHLLREEITMVSKTGSSVFSSFFNGYEPLDEHGTYFNAPQDCSEDDQVLNSSPFTDDSRRQRRASGDFPARQFLLDQFRGL